MKKGTFSSGRPREVLNKMAFSSFRRAGTGIRRPRVAGIGILASFGPGFGPFTGFPRPLRRPQDVLTPCGGNNRRASTRLASANRLNNCAVFLASPR